MSELLSSLKESLTSSSRPPWRQFLDLSFLSLPPSLSDAATRAAQNLSHFLPNYLLLLLAILLLSLLRHPLAILLFLLLFSAWYFLFFTRHHAPLTVLNLVLLNHPAVALILSVVTLLAVFFARVWVNVVVAGVVGVLVVCVHACLRGTEDLVVDDLESPYGPMLSGGDTAGPYIPV